MTRNKNPRYEAFAKFFVPQAVGIMTGILTIMGIYLVSQTHDGVLRILNISITTFFGLQVVDWYQIVQQTRREESE